MSHKDEMIRSLMAAQSEIRNQAAGGATIALNKLSEAEAALTAAHRGIVSAAGYTSQAYGDTSQLGNDLSSLEEDYPIDELNELAETLRGWLASAMLLINRYDQAISAERAAGGES